MKKGIVVMILCLAMLLIPNIQSYADENNERQNGLDVMFVIDASGSMKSNDPDRIALDMVKAFIDTVHIDNIRIGYVAYNDQIVSSMNPQSITDLEGREGLKNSLDMVTYSGNTDIGLGLSHAYERMGESQGRNRIIVLISDGETDLAGTKTGRTLNESEADLNNTIRLCQSEEIPLYTIAFGNYDGRKAQLEQIAANTGANAYTAQAPETLIEVFYGIFGNNMPYKIQEVASGVYASGMQEIRYILDEMYLDEMDFLLISPEEIGETEIFYGSQPVNTTSLSHYAVGKITDLDHSQQELTVKTTTAKNQELKLYLIHYRYLEPVIELTGEAGRNDTVPYELYFRDKNGKKIQDESFYKGFQWEVNTSLKGALVEQLTKQDSAIKDGVIQGEMSFLQSGSYQIHGYLTDKLGNYQFKADFQITNMPPSGSLPDDRFTVLGPEKNYNLPDYFRDANQDRLTFSMEPGSEGNAAVTMNETTLNVKPGHSGRQSVTIYVSDGETTFAYPWQIYIHPLWQVYWWVIALVIVAAGMILWKIFHKPKPMPELIAEKKALQHFVGKLDAYFTSQPEDTEEIPPLVFNMFKIKINKVSLGELMMEYKEASEALELSKIYLIADEERRMILYHNSNSSVMIGNSIVCRQIQYSVSFGDIIYISSPDGTYDLEVHYIAMIQ